MSLAHLFGLRLRSQIIPTDTKRQSSSQRSTFPVFVLNLLFSTQRLTCPFWVNSPALRSSSTLSYLSGKHQLANCGLFFYLFGPFLHSPIFPAITNLLTSGYSSTTSVSLFYLLSSEQSLTRHLWVSGPPFGFHLQCPIFPTNISLSS